MKRKFHPCFLALMISCAILSPADSSVEELKKSVVETGKLNFKSDVPVRYLSRPQISQYITDLFEKEYPDDLAAREETFARLMGFSGFTSAPVPLKNMRKKIILENVGGMYNEKTKELLALEEFRNSGMMNMLPLIHELRHSIQDQHFGLARILGDGSDFDDRKLAVLAAIEGDATFVMIRQMGLDPGEFGSTFSPETILSFSSVAGATELPQSPDLVKYQLLMPYLEGLKFSSAIFAKKKWSGLNRVLARPPVSSEQILHPEKYLLDEKPLPVEIRYVPSGLTLYHSGVIGEYFLKLLLKTDEPNGETASGWGGDRFNLYRNPGSWMLIWESRWDRENDCSNFSAAFQRWIEREFSVVFASGENDRIPFAAGESPAGFFFLRKEGSRLFYLRTSDRKMINEFISGGLYD